MDKTIGKEVGYSNVSVDDAKRCFFQPTGLSPTITDIKPDGYMVSIWPTENANLYKYIWYPDTLTLGAKR